MNADASVENNNQKPDQKFPSTLILLIIGAILLIAAIILYPEARSRMEEQSSAKLLELSLTPEAESIEVTNPETSTPIPIISPIPDPSPTALIVGYPSQFGTLVLSIREGTDIHLFAYQPFLEKTDESKLTALPLTRITSGNQQDITPSINPAGTKIAFSSNRNGFWDLYIFDLLTTEIIQLTDTRAYDGNPTWSPDGQWLAYESYHINNLDIFIQDIDQTQGPIPLTNHPAADFSPSWSGQGRKISFITTRNGIQEVWYADLDSTENDKAVRVKNLPGVSVNHPTWTTDGRYLSWSIVTEEGNHSLVTWDSNQPEKNPVLTGTGDWPLWAGTGELLYALQETPFDTYLTAYPGIDNNFQVMMPAVKMPGHVTGFSWAEGIILPTPLDAASEVNPTPIWNPAPQQDEDQEIIKKDLIQLRNLSAPYPRFNQDAINSFKALRQETSTLSGWDFLSTLENAYVPLTEHVDRGVTQNWLYTGRGFLVNDLPRLANWMIVVREDFGSQTFWRLYIRANKQDGSQGLPLHSFAWDINARYSGSNMNYENGGALSVDITEGYWIDFTELAAVFGWERFPALSYWQYTESAARYQYFAFKQGLSLQSALLELYSPQSAQSITGSANP